MIQSDLIDFSGAVQDGHLIAGHQSQNMGDLVRDIRWENNFCCLRIDVIQEKTMLSHRRSFITPGNHNREFTAQFLFCIELYQFG